MRSGKSTELISSQCLTLCKKGTQMRNKPAEGISADCRAKNIRFSQKLNRTLWPSHWRIILMEKPGRKLNFLKTPSLACLRNRNVSEESEFSNSFFKICNIVCDNDSGSYIQICSEMSSTLSLVCCPVS